MAKQLRSNKLWYTIAYKDFEIAKFRVSIYKL